VVIEFFSQAPSCLHFHTQITGNRLRALSLPAQQFAAAEALPMLMPNEPEDGFLS
jgi:hypothetical protein